MSKHDTNNTYEASISSGITQRPTLGRIRARAKVAVSQGVELSNSKPLVSLFPLSDADDLSKRGYNQEEERRGPSFYTFNLLHVMESRVPGTKEV